MPVIDGVRLKRRLPDCPRERRGRRSIEPRGNFGFFKSDIQEVADMDILHIAGSVCSIAGLIFAIIVYKKSKNIRK